MNNAIFSMSGRLTRRDYALSIAALFGGAFLILSIALYILLPAAHTTAVILFREPTAPFWGLLIAGAALILTLVYCALPLAAIPATVRRLHDMGHSGLLAFPLLLASPLPVGLSVFSLLIIAVLMEGLGYNLDLGFVTAEEMAFAIGGFVFIYIALVFIAMLVLALFGAWVFLKKGDPLANRYGEPPIEEQLPSVRAAYFPMQGGIARAPFIRRTLILLAVAGLLVPSIGQSVIMPIAFILAGLQILPPGGGFFIVFLIPGLSPFVLLPLILARLRTLGRSRWEAALIYAPFLQNILVSWKITPFFAMWGYIDPETLSPDFFLGLLSVSGDGDVLLTLSTVCGILALIGIIRLLDRDKEDIVSPLS